MSRGTSRGAHDRKNSGMLVIIIIFTLMILGLTMIIFGIGYLVR